LGATTGGAAVSDKAMADSLHKVVDQCVRDVVHRQGWDCRVLPVMIPPQSGFGEWSAYRAWGTGVFVPFLVQIIPHQSTAGAFGNAVHHYCSTGPPVYNKAHGYGMVRNWLLGHRIAPEVQQGLLSSPTSLHALVECANEMDFCGALCRQGLSMEMAQMAILSCRLAMDQELMRCGHVSIKRGATPFAPRFA